MVIGFILMLLWAFLAHYIVYGLLCPIPFFMGILDSFVFLDPFAFLGPFFNFTFSWAFINSFGFLWPNYLIPHPWGSWAFYQPITFLLHYFGSAVAHSHFSTSHITHGFTTYLSGLL